MTAIGAAPAGRARIAALVGLVLCLPRIVLSWIVADSTAVLVIAMLAFLAGVAVLGGLLYGRIRAARPGRSRWLPGLVGLVVAFVGALLTSAVTGAAASVAVAGFTGGLVPAHVALLDWAYLAVIALWIVGVVLLVGAFFGGLAVLRGRR